MKHLICTLILAAIAVCTTLGAADKIAVAEPVNKNGVKSQDIEALWGILEISIKSREYQVVSRNALKQLLTEIGLTTSSDLVNLNSHQKARLGQISTVKYILVTELAKFGSKLNCTIKIMDSSTAEIDQDRTLNLRINDLDELADKIEYELEKMLNDKCTARRSAILYPQLHAIAVPPYFVRTFNSQIEHQLLRYGAQLQNLQSVERILERNNLDRPNEFEPSQYRKLGRLLEVEYLIRPTITRFEIKRIPFYVAETGAQGHRMIGYWEGEIRIISGQTGKLISTIPFEERVNFRRLNRRETQDWDIEDYGKYLIKNVVRKTIIPEMRAIPELKMK